MSSDPSVLSHTRTKVNLDWGLLAEITVISATEAAALASIRNFVLTKKKRYMVGGIIGYLLVAIQLPGPLSRGDLGTTNVILNGASSLLGVAVGSIVFKEKMQLMDYIAIPLTTVGTLLLAGSHD